MKTQYYNLSENRRLNTNSFWTLTLAVLLHVEYNNCFSILNIGFDIANYLFCSIEKNMTECSSSFIPPLYYKFRPFFTLQPIAETRHKQLKLWRELILAYHEHHKLYSMGLPSSFPLFRNEAIDRQLSQESIEAIVKSLLNSHEAEWEDEATRTNLLIFWRTPSALARDIGLWAVQKLTKFDCVIAIVEIYTDELSPFLGVDAALIRKALEILEEEGKCLIIEDTGVKFVV